MLAAKKLLWTVFAVLGIAVAMSIVTAFLPLVTAAGAALLFALFALLLPGGQSTALVTFTAVVVILSVLGLAIFAALYLSIRLIVKWWPRGEAQTPPQPLPPPAE